MKIVIDIDDETYKRVMASPKVYALNGVDFIGIEKGIYYGTPLPEHHGRLIDADDIRVIELEDSLHIIRHEKGDDVDVYIDAPTIIEGSESE